MKRQKHSANLCGMTDTSTKPEVVTTDDGDHDRFAHVVRKGLLADAIVFGTEIEALCGKKWVPSRNPENYPICPECIKVHDRIVNSGAN